MWFWGLQPFATILVLPPHVSEKRSKKTHFKINQDPMILRSYDFQDHYILKFSDLVKKNQPTNSRTLTVIERRKRSRVCGLITFVTKVSFPISVLVTTWLTLKLVTKYCMLRLIFLIIFRPSLGPTVVSICFTSLILNSLVWSGQKSAIWTFWGSLIFYAKNYNRK